MTRYMLDTNTVSRIVKAVPALDERLTAIPIASLCVSAITLGELHYGLAKRPEAKRLHAAVRELLRRLDLLPWNSRVAERYGILRAGQESRGKPLASLDLLIAAHALEVDAVLVTGDKAFRQVAGLRVEDWAQ